MVEQFKELEYKYNADNVKLEDFNNFIGSISPPWRTHKDVSSWDIYYLHENIKDYFIRYRKSGDTPELTKKRKTKDSNNWDRVEVDLPIDANRIDDATVEKFVQLDGYKENFRIYKSCFIFWFDNINVVWYVVYDENMKEKGRFIEIEINKDKVTELGDKAADVLKDFETKLGTLGITHKHRLKKSLFEMYIK